MCALVFNRQKNMSVLTTTTTKKREYIGLKA